MKFVRALFYIPSYPLLLNEISLILKKKMLQFKRRRQANTLKHSPMPKQHRPRQTTLRHSSSFSCTNTSCKTPKKRTLMARLLLLSPPSTPLWPPSAKTIIPIPIFSTTKIKPPPTTTWSVIFLALPDSQARRHSRATIHHESTLAAYLNNSRQTRRRLWRQLFKLITAVRAVPTRRQ